MKKYVGILAAFFLFVFASQGAFAVGSTVVGISPSTGSYAAPFTVDLIIDGHGDIFNAAQAKIVLAPSLFVKDLTLGDCGFSFIRTPTTNDLSFEGVLLGSSSKKCTVYTLTLVPVKNGSSTVSIVQAKVLRYGDAAEILSSVQNGTYTVTASEQTSSSLQSLQSKPHSTLKDYSYSVSLTVLSARDSLPVPNTTVTLNTPDRNMPQQQTTNTSGVVLFSHLKKGIYVASIQQQNGQTQETIINVSGKTHTLVLTMAIQTPASPSPTPSQVGTLPVTKPVTIQFPFVLYVVGGGMAMLLLGATLLFFYFKKVRKDEIQK